MSTTPVKSRFCPSPTGLLHMGNIRTALFNKLFALKKQGVFLLRIEDTDKARSDALYTEALKRDMQWLDLDWDEGPDHDKGRGPYWQSERQKIYDQYYLQLEQQKLAYPCFCSEEELALARKVQRASGKPPRYPGTCLELSAAQIEEKIAAGIKPVLRFHIPPDGETVFHDLVRGEQRFKHSDIGDFIIRRADGTPPFMYCNAIDDALMEVTHALRGVDHLTNTPRQLMILKALGLKAPEYGHISLIVGDDGTPLSKRNGSRSIEILRETGFLPLAVNNYLARLGHFYADNDLMSLETLAEKFSLEHLGSAPARYNAEQLLHWQHTALLQLAAEDLWQWMGQDVHARVPESQKKLFIDTIRPNVTFPQDALHWAQVLFSEALELNEEAQAVLAATSPEFFTIVLAVLDAHGVNYEAVITALKSNLNLKGKALFQPLRLALTGESHGPELVHVFELMGPERLKQRLKVLELPKRS